MLRLLICVLLTALSAGSTIAGEKVALVIGNSRYEHVSYLPNASQDAEDLSRSLRNLGFRVVSGTDLTRTEILTLAQNMQKILKPDDVALFYFSGHAVQIGTENFLIPIDAFGDDEETIRQKSVKLQTILAEMERKADRNIVILDACRNNPFDLPASARSLGGVSRGLAKVDAGVGSFIAFSTQPGNVALDGSGRNSPFTAALLRYLPSKDDDLHEVMRKVRRDVVAETNSSQIPWENSSLLERVYLGAREERPNPSPKSSTQLKSNVWSTSIYEVTGLDPNGDGFLALRSGTSGSAVRLMKMTEGTRLQVLGQDGLWFKVRTETGAEGWAHSNWIRFVGARSAQQNESCESLWYQRNAIFSRNGYCFQGSRGRQAFSNTNCRIGIAAADIPLTAMERREVAQFASRERALQCK